MENTRQLIVLMFISLCMPNTLAEKKQLSRQELIDIAAETTIYLYPLVVFHKIKDVTTNVQAPRVDGGILRAPLNQLISSSQLLGTNYKDTMRVNNDMLLTTGFIDVSKEAMVLSVPAITNHYFLVEFIDEWTNVRSFGSKTEDKKAFNYIILGPNYKGQIPVVPSMKLIQSATNILWLKLYIQPKDEKDYKNIQTIQTKIRLVPLNYFEKAYTPTHGKVDYTIDMKTPPLTQVNMATGKTFFNAAASILNKITVPILDKQILDKLSLIEINQGKPFSFDSLYVGLRDALSDGLKKGIKQIREGIGHLSQKNGWTLLPLNSGNYGIDYFTRAVVASFDSGASLSADEFMAYAFVDGANKQLNGINSYMLHFAKDQMPPVKGFWSITLYAEEQGSIISFVPNEFNRTSINSLMQISYNKDGSLDIHIQSTKPGADKTNNWLPAPKGPFSLVARLYEPDPKVLNNTWLMPAVIAAKQAM